jgi:hypothetical protein
MAGPSVAVRIYGDLSNWAKSVSGAGETAATGASRIKGAFSGVLGALNKTGVLAPFQEALDGVGEAFDELTKKGSTAADKLTGTGTALAGIGVGLMTIGSGQKAAQQQLSAAITATGGSYQQYAGDVSDAVKEEEKHGETASETMTALQMLTQATHSPAAALKDLGIASDLAASRHESLQQASEDLGRTIGGSTRIYKEYGIQVTKAGAQQKALNQAEKAVTTADDAAQKAKQKLVDVHILLAGKTHLTAAEQVRLRDAQIAVTDTTAKQSAAHGALAVAQDNAKKSTNNQSDALAQLAKVIHGQADAQANTFTGHLKDMKAWAETTVSTFANRFGPSITAAGTAMAGLGATMNVAKGAQEAYKNATQDGSLATKAYTVIQGIFNAVMDANPIVIVVLALAALVAAVVLAYTHFKVFRDIVADVWDFVKTAFDGIVAAFKKVWDWIQQYWPLLLGILLLPFSLFVAGIVLIVTEVVQHWQAVWDFISSIGSKIEGYFRDAITWLQEAGKDIVNGLLTGIYTIAKDLWSWLEGLGGRLVGYFDKAVTWLVQAGKDVVSGLLTGIYTAAQDVWTWFGGIGGRLVGYFDKAVTWLVQAGKDVVGGIVSGISTAASDVWDFFTGKNGIGQKIIGYFKDAGTWLFDAGKAIVTGLLKGIANVAEKPLQAVGKLASGASKIFSKVLGIFSPSSVFKEYGENVVAGFVQGISGSTGDAHKAVATMAGGTIDAGISGSTSSSNAIAARGPAVVIQTAHFNDPVDVDTLLQRATFAVRANKI